MKLLRSQTGAAQILMAIVMSGVVLTGAIYLLDLARKLNHHEVRHAQKSELHAALELAVREAYNIYKIVGCDPTLLDDYLARMQSNGLLPPPPVPGNPPIFNRRQLDITVNDRTYTVGFAPVKHIEWAPANRVYDPANPEGGEPLGVGVAQDAVIEVWSHRPGAQFRAHQGAVLVNTCSYRCSYASTDHPEYCPNSTVAADRDVQISMHRITDPANFPAAGDGIPVGCSDGGNRYFGDISLAAGGTCALPTPEALPTIDVKDVYLLREYLRTGTFPSSCQSVIVGTPGANFGCGDLNRDSQVTEYDLAILEKALRGYISFLPVHFQ